MAHIRFVVSNCVVIVWLKRTQISHTVLMLLSHNHRERGVQIKTSTYVTSTRGEIQEARVEYISAEPRQAITITFVWV